MRTCQPCSFKYPLSSPFTFSFHLNSTPISICIHSYPLFFSSSFSSRFLIPWAWRRRQPRRQLEMLTPAPFILANGEPRMQFWEHEALPRCSRESHAPRVPREEVAADSPSSSPPLEGALPSPPAVGTWWQQHRRRRTRRVSPPRRPGSTEEAPHAPAKAAAAGSILMRRHQAAAAGSSHERWRWNVTADTARVAIIKVAAQKPSILDWFRGPSGVASLTFISSIAVSGGEEEDDLKACWWTWRFGFGLEGLLLDVEV